MKIGLALLAVMMSLSLADSATQTDWSGGPGVLGPVTSWGTAFQTDVCTRWTTPGALLLAPATCENAVTEKFDCVCDVHSDDIDGDGDMDVLGGSSTRGIIWWENVDGSGTTWCENVVDSSFTGTFSAHAVDIDDDGDLDILGASFTKSKIKWWENLDGIGTSWTGYYIDDNFEEATCAYSGDIDGDGDMDVLGTSQILGRVAWWENRDGQGTDWQFRVIDYDFGGAMCVHSDDLDADGDLDVVGAAYYGDEVAWWENVAGSGTSWVRHLIDDNVDGAMVVYTADLDGDNDVDVVGAVYQGDRVQWWENLDGSGTLWGVRLIEFGFQGANGVHSQDMDSDGDMDVLATARYQHDVIWWENQNGSGKSWFGHVVDDAFIGAEDVYAEDFDGDGDMDVLGGAWNSGLISWWDVSVHQPTGYAESSILYLKNDPGWGLLDWSASEPTGTSVSFQVRACDYPDSSSMGPWSDILSEPPCDLSGILDDWDSYFQYRAILGTSDIYLTPALYDVTLTWDPLGLGEPLSGETSLRGALANPCRGSAVIGFTLGQESLATFSVFDLSGRVVDERRGQFPMGESEITMSEVRPGIYFVRMTAGDFSATRRFVVME